MNINLTCFFQPNNEISMAENTSAGVKIFEVSATDADTQFVNQVTKISIVGCKTSSDERKCLFNYKLKQIYICNWLLERERIYNLLLSSIKSARKAKCINSKSIVNPN